jgi:uncharacterized protein (TIGR03435 family)
MKTNQRKFRIAALFLGAALAGSAAPEFDAASVRLNIDAGKRGGLSFTPGRLTATALNLRSLIIAAYDIRDYQLAKGPAWTTSDAYDIAATAAGPATEAELRVMLQALLADRFQLTIHREQRDLDVYALIVAKNGPKLKPSDGPTSTQLAAAQPGLTFKGTSMSAFAKFIANLGPVGGRPVLDRTGLTGTFDFTLIISDMQAGALPPDETKRAVANWPSLFTDLQEQLGLKLESQKAPTEVLVIDRIAKPSEN